MVAAPTAASGSEIPRGSGGPRPALEPLRPCHGRTGPVSRSCAARIRADLGRRRFFFPRERLPPNAARGDGASQGTRSVGDALHDVCMLRCRCLPEGGRNARAYGMTPNSAERHVRRARTRASACECMRAGRKLYAPRAQRQNALARARDMDAPQIRGAGNRTRDTIKKASRDTSRISSRGLVERPT